MGEEDDNWIEQITAGTGIEDIDRELINGPCGTVQTDCIIWGSEGLRNSTGFNSKSEGFNLIIN